MRLLIVFIVVFLVAFVLLELRNDNEGGTSQDEQLDFSKPIYTNGHAIICPLGVLYDLRANHGREAILNMYMFDRENKADSLGCEVLQGGVQVNAVPMKQNLGGLTLIQVNSDFFTAKPHLTNRPESE